MISELISEIRMAKVKLGWEKAREHARTIVYEGSLTRVQHFQIFKRFYNRKKKQDLRLAVALLGYFIESRPDDFDRNVKLDDLIEYGNKLCELWWKDFGRGVLYKVLLIRQTPAIWVDKIADEETEGLRKAFVIAIEELARRKKNPLDRILGLAAYFIDDPSAAVREQMVKVLTWVGKRDKERLHYFLVDFRESAGSHRLAMFKAVRENLDWETDT